MGATWQLRDGELDERVVFEHANNCIGRKKNVV